MKEVRQAIVLVDAHRRPSERHSTAGRYRVDAKTEKEAEELVRKTIGFGSVQFYYWEDKSYPVPAQKAKYKRVLKEIPCTHLADTKYTYEQPRHACSPRTQ